MVHLGLGNFFRAHQAWYTALAPDSQQWGIAAFAGRSHQLADAMSAQDGLYTLITSAAQVDQAMVVGSVPLTFSGTDDERWQHYLALPEVAVVTLTVTEAGYLDVMPAKIVSGLRARRAAGSGALAIVSCDNLPRNGTVTKRVVLARAALEDAELAQWIASNVSFVTTMVDRITPATQPQDVTTVLELTGVHDAAPVRTEPFSEWVLAGDFPAGRPTWEGAGARFVEDIEPFEQRKLRLLNGAHSLLAYAGSARGHQYVCQAIADEVCLGWVHQWWVEARRHLTLPPGELEQYCQALLDRFSNPRINHLLFQIATDGSQKLPIRLLSTIAAERTRGAMPVGALRIIAAWINYLRGGGATVKDVAAQQMLELVSGSIESAVQNILGFFDAELAADSAVLKKVGELVGEFVHHSSRERMS